MTNGSVIFSDLSSSLSPYFKRFSIGRSELEQVNGGPLLDGTYTFRLKALDLQSNVVSSSDFTFQLDTHAPTLYLSNSVADVDTNTPGIQTVEYSTLRFRSGIFDDGGVSKLELLMNSNVLVTGTFFPWEDFLVQAPAYVAGSNLFRIQTRGTDLAGNTALSAPVDIEVVPDGTNPTVASVSPLDGMTLTNLNVDHVTVSFSKPISPGSLNPTNFILLEAGPNGLFGDGDDVVIRVSDLLLSDDDTVVRIGFPALLFGSYQIRLAATRIMDRTGHSLGTNELGVVVGQFKVSPVADLRLTSKCQSSLSTLPERADKESP